MRSAALLCVSLALLATFASSDALRLPSYVKACSKRDPKLNECALKHGKAAIAKLIPGDPKYRIPRLDPLLIERIVINQRGLGMKLVCEKCTIRGLKHAELKAARINLEGHTFGFDLEVPRLDVLGKYTASGRILVLPINGKGDLNITLTDAKVGVDMEYTLYKKHGKQYMKFEKEPVIKYAVGRLYIRLTNLFNGDKNLGDNMNRFLDENWRELLKELGEPISKSVAEIVLILLSGITDIVPADEVFTD